MAIIKICGVGDRAALTAAVSAGATHVGFVFHPKSPRHLQLDEAQALRAEIDVSAVHARPQIVALVADKSADALAKLADAVRPDSIQCHGQETPHDLTVLRAALPAHTELWKAFGVTNANDLAESKTFGEVADTLVLDARPPADAAYGGGHGRTFDWSVLAQAAEAGHLGAVPWVLAGGLTPETVAGAVARVGALPGFAGVDVSSGVESAPGQKDPVAIHAFIRAARRAMDTL
ncbi:MAG: phosphoribosylanthranilate isomerase [Pseudomonadota bacterium]